MSERLLNNCAYLQDPITRHNAMGIPMTRESGNFSTG